ncbi:hypothetical protein [Campylobacter geochelonis]|uniref:HdrB C-terminal domain-containing protein n=1 Tax=Campylobacter geochelonis TaxID=1780362 RepID=UPI001F61C601|nr:hypothetical protein [Campylobacter geochelonis]
MKLASKLFIRYFCYNLKINSQKRDLMLEIYLFRYDVKIDISSYNKPYFYKDYNFKNIKELFLDIQKNDPYFEFGDVKFLKVNDCIISLDNDFNEIVAKFGKVLTISPIIEKRVVKDFIINKDDFIKAFKPFDKFQSEMGYYLSLEPLFYSSKVINFKEDFIGNSGFVFAKYLIEKFPTRQDEILSIVKEWLAYYIKPKFLNDPFNTDECVKELKGLLGIKIKPKEKFQYFTDLLENFNKNSYPADFSKFYIAVYDDEEAEIFVKNIYAKLVNFELKNQNCGSKIYNVDKECGVALASEILFDAFDSGSDFLLVNDKEAFEMFDKHSKEIESYTNRSLHDYYVISADELVKLAKGEHVDTLKSHTLKVRL